MTNPLASALPRRIICSECGIEFSCALSGECWCAAEPARLPMPAGDSDCACRSCLREAAARSAARNEAS